MNHLVISIPAYNDSATVGSLIEKSLATLSKISDRHGVFAINDGSRDETWEVLKKIASSYPKVHIHNHEKNLGFGVTIREVYLLPESEWVFFIPGDGQIPPSEILKLYPFTKSHTFILGHRKKRNDPWMRKFNSWCYNWTISLIAGRRIHDVNSVALIKREILQGIEFESTGAFIHAEILLKALGKGASLIEVEIEHKPRLHGRGSGNKWKVILATVKDMIKYLLS